MSSSMPGISFQLQSNRVYIFHSTILALDEPKYIRLLFNLEKKHLAVQTCARRMPESFVVPRYEPNLGLPDFKFSLVQNAVRMLFMGER